MSLSVTLADANILVSRTLRDYFVYAAKTEDEILATLGKVAGIQAARAVRHAAGIA